MEANFTNNSETIHLGSKYYNDDNLYRVLSFANADTVRVLDLVSKEIVKLNTKTLKKDYTLLLPDAVLSFNIAQLPNNIEDVIVFMNRFSDLNDGNQLPYCVCRQNIRDIHANIIKNDFLHQEFVGCSVSIDSIPPEVDYRIMLACEGLNYYTMVYTYIDDSLEDILSCIPRIDKYDRVLDDLFRSYAKFKHLPIGPESDGIYGYCSTLRKLLVDNNFMYDFRTGLGVWQIDTEMVLTEDHTIDPKLKESIEIMITHRINNEVCIPYRKDTDIDAIKRSYVLVADSKDELYLIVYDKGYGITYDPDNDLIIRFNTNKYFNN